MGNCECNEPIFLVIVVILKGFSQDKKLCSQCGTVRATFISHRAVQYINKHKGNEYELAYESPHTRTIYEISFLPNSSQFY